MMERWGSSVALKTLQATFTPRLLHQLHTLQGSFPMEHVTPTHVWESPSVKKQTALRILSEEEPYILSVFITKKVQPAQN